MHTGLMNKRQRANLLCVLGLLLAPAAMPMTETQALNQLTPGYEQQGAELVHLNAQPSLALKPDAGVKAIAGVADNSALLMDPAKHPGAVTSPLVGIAYLAPEPGAAPFVRLGDSVSAGQTLLIIEAMKVMNQIPAPRAGRIARLLVESGSPVEYGQVLLILQ